MSSFSSTVKFKTDKQGDLGEFQVLSFKYTAQSTRDLASGQPSGRITGSIVELEVSIAPKTLMALQALYTNDVASGEVNFHKIDQQSTYLKIKIEKASFFFFEQVFNSHQPDAFIVMMKLSAAKLVFECEGITTENEFFYRVGATSS